MPPWIPGGNLPFSPPDNEGAESGDVSMGEEQQQSQQRQAQCQKFNNLRACQSCRASKVRCDQPNPGMPCLRCQKSGKLCIDAASQPGKRQRILEMESRIELMLSSAEMQDSAVCSPSELSHNTQQHDRNPSMGSVIPFNGGIQLWLDNNITDLDDHTTETIFSHYVTNMAPTFPVVIFPPGTTAADVRSNNPILFLAILDVASSGFCALETQRKLRKLIVQAYIYCMLRTEQYTLGLLQALIVSATWYRIIEPVEPGEQMDIYQISHTAANMALIMGLGESLNAKSWGGPMFPRREKLKGPGSAFQAESLEARRVWLGCHYICSNTSMSLRAPNVMRWTRLMDECLEVLEASPVALPSDRLLCQHIRLQHITEEFVMHLSMEETSAPEKSRAIQIQVTHRAFKRQLNEWRRDVADGWDVAHCTAMSDDVPSEDDTQCLTPPTLIVAIEPHAITEFMETIDNIFRVFTSLDMSTIRVLPTVYLIRTIYTFIILVKLYFAAVKLPAQDAVLQVNQLKVSERLNRVIQMTAGWGPLWPATKLTTVFIRMRSWFESGEEGNRQRLQQAGSWLTVWELRPPSHSRDAHAMNMVEAASDDGSIVASSSRGPASWVPSLASTDVDTLAFSLEPPLGTDFSIAPPPFQSMSRATESCFPRKEAPDLMQEAVPLAAGQRLGDLPDIDQMGDTAYVGMDWSQFSNMGFDLYNSDAPFSPIPPPGFDPDAAMKENISDRNK
ncbi:Zn(II)2Cys6 transcription factor [Aspergillus fischeri NRRL 181]|uniref:C6 zinc finger domain protein n=1 Tax=Neosartorya fischeri (strain ATCC 1020 / DSM 3700 / CBS 544.65 / FGSC A1164 / JCM 1740 / NRRL 181 / WB 181) TaxID=331117 RepID=A1D1L1_NEOFI|nr:C6 zinc finger domain protein [Aspergillus fischeri NRRL 181]EAW22304.1 C6 zinc finger domain protein [Aspergillus fischeri NRRL 181]